MNRIVLIGNGFDLAHGLRTKYEHFIDWYLDQKDSSEKLYKEKIKNYDLYVANMNFKHIDESMIEYSTFLKNILKRVGTKQWVDIENEYYALLIRYTYPNIDNSLKQESPKILNEQLEHLKIKLIDYLKLEVKKDVNYIPSIKDKIYRPIKKREIAVANLNYLGNKNSKDVMPNNIMLLNFNYTMTEEQYKGSGVEVQVNHIHGCLDKANSVIFGYGDELDSDFEKLKNLNDNECLRNMKSIRYLEAENYREMLEFIESGPFQVCIMGHSCGNSDRTLLNTLFEHRFCVSVKPYYYKKDGTDNYLELVQNISRSFTDMKLMRDRVVNKTFCEPLTD